MNNDYINNNIDTIWNKVLMLAEKCFPQQTFNTWIKSLISLSYEENLFTIGAPQDIIRRKVLSNYSKTLQTLLNNVCGRELELNIINLDLPVENNNEFDEEPIVRPSKIQTEQSTVVKQPLNNDISFNNRFTFEQFVVGNSNRGAYSAAMAVAESPSKSYNPLFLYGHVGVGKTHLMHAIGNRIISRFNNMKIIYKSCEQVTNEFIHYLREKDLASFRNKYRDVDVFMVDDIQFLSGKTQTQEEFFHTFNTLHQANRQIVLTSDKQPQEIANLESRLSSRFASGLMMDIGQPDLETRTAILNAKASLENIDLSPEVANYIAINIIDNVRELEGALTRVIAYCSFNSEPINLENAGLALQGMLKKLPKIVNCQTIINIVAGFYKLKTDDILGNQRTRNKVLARQIAMYLCRETINGLSFPQLGFQFGGKDHTTVIHAYDKINRLLEKEENIKREIEQIKRIIEDS